MDFSTVRAYDDRPADYATEWESQPVPADMYELIREFFKPGRTADIGCGSGRDTAWLAENGFEPTGFDPSTGLLDEARRRHPNIPFRSDSLPHLDTIADASYLNVLCETVIMHLEPAEIDPSVRRMLAILEPGGTLYLSWRVTVGSDLRDEHGRLYSAFDFSSVSDALSYSQLLHDAETTSASSGKVIRRIVVRKPV